MLLEIVGSLKLTGSSTSIRTVKVMPLGMTGLMEDRSHDPLATTTSEPSNQPAVPPGGNTGLAGRPLRGSLQAYSEDMPRAAEVLSTEDAMALLKSSIRDCLGAIVGTLVSITQINKTGIKYE